MSTFEHHKWPTEADSDHGMATRELFDEMKALDRRCKTQEKEITRLRAAMAAIFEIPVGWVTFRDPGEAAERMRKVREIARSALGNGPAGDLGPDKKKCKACFGDGEVIAGPSLLAPVVACPKCEGTGLVYEPVIGGDTLKATDCEQCKGTGKP